MKQFIILLLFATTLVSCLTPYYNINNNGFHSNRKLWSLSIAELQVDSINKKGFPSKYSILREVDASQKGDHKYDDPIKEYGYNWKPRNRIPFKRTNKYFSWWDHSTSEKFECLPLVFKKQNWYLLTQWEPSSAGGGIFNLFVYINEKGKFEKYYDIQTNGPFFW